MVKIVSDVRSTFGAARDQGKRPTCLAFAASDLHAACRKQPFEELSPEFLFCLATRQCPNWQPSAGVNLSSVEAVLANDGQPLEIDWPYLPALPSLLSTWRPPSGLSLYKRPLRRISDTTGEVIRQLDNGQPIMICLRLTDAFYYPDAEGIVTPLTSDRETANHAVVCVAHGLRGFEEFILVRNSWGKTWGLDGHAWLPVQYVKDRAYAAAVI